MVTASLSLSHTHTNTDREMSSHCSDLCGKKDLKRGAWTREEDERLYECVKVHGETKWRLVPAKAGLNRRARSCRMRWLNYLKPNIKRGNITEQEEDLIIRLHKLLGNRWALIAGRLPGRTDNEIKNYWKTHLSKKVKHQQHQQKEKQPISKFEQEKNRSAEDPTDGSSEKFSPPPTGGVGFSANEFDIDQLLDVRKDINGYWNSNSDGSSDRSGNMQQGTPPDDGLYSLDLDNFDGYVSSMDCDTDFQSFFVL